MAAMPAVFLGHGSPLNAIEDNEFRRAWQALGRTLPRPEAVLCVSAHWETRGVYVTTAGQPATIHDFYGFPEALRRFRYPAPGAPWLGARVRALAGDTPVHEDPARGLDHGAWCVLSAMFPQADVPVAQLGLDSERAGDFHYDLGRRLAPLRDEGVLLLGSGNVVHNLLLYRAGAEAPDWALRFDAAVRERVASRSHRDLVEWHRLAPDAHRAVPTPEHYLPLLYVLGAQRGEESAAAFSTRPAGSISMSSFVVGAPAPAFDD